MGLREEILAYADEKYQTKPDHPFQKAAQHAVLRHRRNQRWYGIIMNVKKSSLKIEEPGELELLAVKAPPELVGLLRQQPGFLPAYHMNKEHWLSIKLNGEVAKEQIFELLDGSFLLTR